MPIIDEGRKSNNGVPMSFHCLRQHLTAPENSHTAQLHYHEYTELLYGRSGMAQVLIGSRRYELPAGSMIIVHTNEPHAVICTEGECRFDVVKFLPHILQSGEGSWAEYSYMLLLMEEMPGKKIFFPPEEMRATDIPALFSNILNEWESHYFGFELGLRADVTRIFLYILRCWREQHGSLFRRIELGGQVTLIRRALSYVREHFSEISGSEAAAACGVSPSYFSRMFKRIMKQSFSDYVNQVRLKEAERLLLLTDDTVTDIAQAAGFSTASYFIRQFREFYGVTPHQYRQRQREVAVSLPIFRPVLLE